jgi:hypothetical protein
MPRFASVGGIKPRRPDSMAAIKSNRLKHLVKFQRREFGSELQGVAPAKERR